MKDLATKVDLNNLRKELKDYMNQVDLRFEEVHQDMADMANTFQAELDKKVDKDHFDAVVATLATKDDLLGLATKDDINKIINMLDHDAKKRDIYESEQTAMKSQLNRHERWHQEVSGHVGYELSVD